MCRVVLPGRFTGLCCWALLLSASIFFHAVQLALVDWLHTGLCTHGACARRPASVQAVAATFLRPHPVRIFVGGTEEGLVAHTGIVQDIRVVHEGAKKGLLQKLVAALGTRAPSAAEPKTLHKTLVFVSKKTLCDELTAEYAAMGLPYGVDGLHGDRDQRDRMTVMKAFKEGTTRLLFATDVAARGLDVADITSVINYDFPVQRGVGGIEDYVHRIGRTARAGVRRGQCE